MTESNNGWPDPSRPGVPLHPERDGWHWLHHPEDIRAFPCAWDSEHAAWCSGGMHSPEGIVDLGYNYLGPCLTPAEHACALADARAQALEEAADAARRVPIPGEAGVAEAHGRMMQGMEAAAAILDLIPTNTGDTP